VERPTVTEPRRVSGIFQARVEREDTAASLLAEIRQAPEAERRRGPLGTQRKGRRRLRIESKRPRFPADPLSR